MIQKEDWLSSDNIKSNKKKLSPIEKHDSAIRDGVVPVLACIRVGTPNYKLDNEATYISGNCDACGHECHVGSEQMDVKKARGTVLLCNVCVLEQIARDVKRGNIPEIDSI